MIDVVNALGGVGLFLFGMIWLTDGLRGLAGQTLRNTLSRFTNTPLSGAVTGAATTALIQSSSATTVTAVGFVSAGLLTFPQALGIIFGANIGTTMTGWLATILGFKLDLGQITLPLVFLGALARLFGGARLPLIGTAVAGFALIFLGIDIVKSSLAAFQGIVTPTDFPQDSLIGRVELILIGALITVVTQSSSAGVIAALAALGAGAISLPQGLAMVIGMDVGTTVTAAIATLGGSTATRRTGLSHVIYNCLTGLMAFFLLSPYNALVGAQGLHLDSQIALVAFHSGFNILGVILILPFTGAFAKLVTLIVRDRGNALTAALGRQMLKDPNAALDAVVSSLDAVVKAQFEFLAKRLEHREATHDDTDRLREIGDAITELRNFVDGIPAMRSDDPAAARLVSVLHVIDHLGRLYFRCTQEQSLTAFSLDNRLRRLSAILRSLTAEAASATNLAATEARLNRVRRLLRAQREVYRTRIFGHATRRAVSGDTLGQRLDAARWLHRVSYHLWRIEHHMVTIHEGLAPASPRREAALDVMED
ncbi:Na/Pi cotransporter family protein [Thioclava atlantica]|uniref:Na/Pi cotransporter family protein n=1 Tax=Thioclava atlantica TaxID=1317124 RepID=UPI00138E0623|nr:Na/Pi symporter [Thioclava atlantica]